MNGIGKEYTKLISDGLNGIFYAGLVLGVFVCLVGVGVYNLIRWVLA